MNHRKVKTLAWIALAVVVAGGALVLESGFARAMTAHAVAAAHGALTSAMARPATGGPGDVTAGGRAQAGPEVVFAAEAMPAWFDLDDEPGVLVAGVVPGSPAEKAGLERGDIVLEADGQALEGPHALSGRLAERESGDVVRLEVRHGDVERTVEVTLADAGDLGTAALGIAPALGVVPCGGGMPLVAAHLAVPGVVAVIPDGPAAAAGLADGDRITAVDGEIVDAEHSLVDLVGAHAPGDKVTLDVARPGEDDRQIEVTLGEHPDDAGRGFLGVRVPDHRVVVRHFGGPGGPFAREMHPLPEGLLEPGEDGVARALPVGGVEEGSAAAAAGLEAGDVITAIDGAPIEAAGDLKAAVAARQPGDAIRLTVRRAGDDGPRELEATLGAHPDEAGMAYLGVSVGFMRRTSPDGGEAGDVLRFEEALPEGLVLPDPTGGAGDPDVRWFHMPFGVEPAERPAATRERL